ncbi:flavodoxin domain-containing protein [Desulfoferrobacter suflitae]|uniref:flavodoxin domain-containing protein n=1 Tax=Desulfoferrobacter suflitae TaxID=2865782 RepID=UPI0021646780|nr:flavodoxin domain-containing protein [Desulfoferrobacter suflitae]MCK8602914.1 flavodoxin domain-containing protein [Desulfoferrobacter suflitae]
MSKALVIYASRTNQTKGIAEIIAEGMRFEGVEATLVNVNDFEKQKINPEEFDAVVLGAPTYHGDMIQPMKTLLFALEKSNLEGRVGGSFGAYGWSGEAPGRIYDTMKHIFKMDMVNGPLMLKSASLGGGVKMGQDYGRDIAKKLQK